ncbi:MAG: FAD-dependent oxidoreductase [Reichenbachiella sp.]
MRDFLLIGHGLAGAVLSQKLLANNHTIRVFDQPEKNNSSSVAAGLFNPVTGRKMVKTWMADELFPEIEPTYADFEEKLRTKFLHKIGIYRPFIDAAEQNDWEGKKTDPVFQKFIDSVARQSIKEFQLNDTYGGLHLSLSGFLDIPTFLKENREYLIGKNSYEEKEFDESQMKISKNGISYQNQLYKRIVFCNGLHASKSQFFNWLPFSPVKGEVLLGKVERSIPKIYNRGIFIVPAGEKEIKVGATYRNNYSDDQPTKEGQKELLDKLAALFAEKFELIEVKAGLRPATKDRRPFIGKHPEYEHIYLFNGFGSKGVSLVPYFAKNFVMFLEDKASLNGDVDIHRYYSLHENA